MSRLSYLFALCALMFAQVQGSIPSVHSVTNAALGAIAPSAKPIAYGSDSTFVGPWNQLPVDSQAHIQRDLAEDRKYVASILRAPEDNGDPAQCDHKDLIRDKAELKRIALSLEHRRASLLQQQKWITDANTGIQKIEDEMRHTKDTARNLAQQIDALQNQKQIILNHVRQQLLQRELDAASVHLVRLKKGAVEQAIKTEDALDTHALANKKSNVILTLLKHRRKENAATPAAPPRIAAKVKKARAARFAQTEQQADNESENQQETQTDSQQEQESESTQESEQSTSTESEQSTEQTTESEEQQ